MSDPAGTSLARSVARRPHPGLRDYVTTYQGYRYQGGDPGVHHGLPSTSLTVVLSFDQPVDVGWLVGSPDRCRTWALASGLSMLPAGIYHDGTQHGIQLDLTPLGSRALLGVPASALRRGLVSLGDLVGPDASRLYDEVAGASGWPARFAALDRELLRLATRTGAQAGLGETTLDHAWRRVHESRGQLAVSPLADEVGWSRRHLTSRFTDEYGIGPKQAARLVRFGTARELVATRSVPLADVAVRCGYADQAHLTRDWRELAGVPPTAWLRLEQPFLQDRDAAS